MILRCNRVTDCPFGEDEVRNYLQMILRCNRVTDCPFGEDEVRNYKRYIYFLLTDYVSRTEQRITRNLANLTNCIQLEVYHRLIHLLLLIKDFPSVYQQGRTGRDIGGKDLIDLTL